MARFSLLAATIAASRRCASAHSSVVRPLGVGGRTTRFSDDVEAAARCGVAASKVDGTRCMQRRRPQICRFRGHQRRGRAPGTSRARQACKPRWLKPRESRRSKPLSANSAFAQNEMPQTALRQPPLRWVLIIVSGRGRAGVTYHCLSTSADDGSGRSLHSLLRSKFW